MCYDISETTLTVYRTLDRTGRVNGYTLNPRYGIWEPLSRLDPGVDTVGQIELHVFGTQSEAGAFVYGLRLTNADVECDLRHCQESVPDGWVVMRLIAQVPEDGCDSGVQVRIHCTRPRALVTVRAGKASLASDEDDLCVCVLDYDAEPHPNMPKRFRHFTSRSFQADWNHVG